MKHSNRTNNYCLIIVILASQDAHQAGIKNDTIAALNQAEKLRWTV